MTLEDRADDIANELVEQAGAMKVRTAGGELVEMDAKAGLEALKAIEARAARRSGKRRVITSINLGGTR